MSQKYMVPVLVLHQWFIFTMEGEYKKIRFIPLQLDVLVFLGVFRQ